MSVTRFRIWNLGQRRGKQMLACRTGTAQHCELEPVADLVIASVAHLELNQLQERG
ncbi:hypothetical protein OK016_29960 [Vibrio chagasii]|nr:hypothetical protein [Vibrio chagasii]